MALIKCPECGKEVSSSAKNCPNCGCPIESRNEAVIRLDSLRVGQIAKVYVDGLQITETSSGSIVTIPVPNGRCNVVFETGGVLAKRSPVFTVEGGKKYQAVWETLQTIKAIVKSDRSAKRGRPVFRVKQSSLRRLLRLLCGYSGLRLIRLPRSLDAPPLP